MVSIRDELLQEQGRIEEKMRKLDELPVGHSLRTGSVLVLQVRFNGNPKIWTYLAFKADNGRWYFTGRGPQDAGWAAVERWLVKDDKVLVRWALNQVNRNLSIGPANTAPPSWAPGDARGIRTVDIGGGYGEDYDY